MAKKLLSREAQHAEYRKLLKEAAQAGELDLLLPKLCRNDLFFLLIYGLEAKGYADNDWCYERCREFEASPNGHLDLWPREHYKDLPVDTPMLTKNRGWTTHGELVPGDMVFSPSGKAVKVVALSPRYHLNRCLKISFQDGKEIVCGEGHLWRVRDIARLKRDLSGYRATVRNERIVEARDLQLGDDIGAIEGAVEFRAASLPVHPYLLGAWLGDGHRRSPRITCSYRDAEIPEYIKSLGYNVKEQKPRDGKTGVYAFGGGVRGKRGSGIYPLLRAMGVTKEKHIPGLYKTASVEQRIMLLRGLMDTDGSCNERGNASFCNASERLAHDVYELAVGLALRPRIAHYWTTCNGKGKFSMWVVSFQAHTDRNPFMLKRKAARAINPSRHRECRRIVSVVEVDPVDTSCIQVEGGMYLAGRDLLPTHNSTIITCAAAIQRILNDPETTIGIFSFSRPIAKGFLRTIKNHFENNDKLKEWFPDILYQNPSSEAPKWSEDDGIVVKRLGFQKESTVEAWGLVDGMPTSKHFSLLIYDDVVVPSSVTSPEMIKKTTEAMGISFNLGREGGDRWMLGTRYHMADTYSELIKRGAVKLRLYAATKDGKFEGEPVLWTRERLDEKIRDMGSYVASCQLFNNPVMEGEQTFREEWIRKYRTTPREGMNVYILVDPASTKKKTSDYTVIAVIALASDHNYYLLDMVRDKLTINERATLLFALHAQYRPITVGYEQYGMQSDIAFLKERMENQNYRFEIIELKGSTPKNDRIKRLQPLFEKNRFYLPERLIRADYQGRTVDVVHDFISDEYLQFPYMTHDDMLDCLSRIQDEDMQVSFPLSSARDANGRIIDDKCDEYDFSSTDRVKEVRGRKHRALSADEY